MKNNIYLILICAYLIALTIFLFPREREYDKQKELDKTQDALIDCINLGDCEELYEGKSIING